MKVLDRLSRILVTTPGCFEKLSPRLPAHTFSHPGRLGKAQARRVFAHAYRRLASTGHAVDPGAIPAVRLLTQGPARTLHFSVTWRTLEGRQLELNHISLSDGWPRGDKGFSTRG